MWTLELPAKLNSFYEQKGQAWHHIAPQSLNPLTYKGRWTNDPSLLPNENLITDGSTPTDHGTVQIEISQDGDGKLSGEIETQLLERSMVPWSRVFLTGHVRPFGGFEGEAWDVVHNRHRTIAYFVLTPSTEMDGQTLRFTSDPKYSQFLPQGTILWHTNAPMTDGQAGTQFTKALMDVVKKEQ